MPGAKVSQQNIALWEQSNQCSSLDWSVKDEVAAAFSDPSRDIRGCQTLKKEAGTQPMDTN